MPGHFSKSNLIKFTRWAKTLIPWEVISLFFLKLKLVNLEKPERFAHHGYTKAKKSPSERSSSQFPIMRIKLKIIGYIPPICPSPRSDICSQKFKFKDWRFAQFLRFINPPSVTSEPERSTESTEDPCEEMTSIQASFTPGHSPKWRSWKYTKLSHELYQFNWFKRNVENTK